MEYTHIVLSYPSQDVEMLFRSEDGMAIGQRKGETVVFGDKPREHDSRVFVDKEHASRFLRGHIASEDLKKREIEGPVTIEDRDGQRGLVLPQNSMDIPRAGLVRMN